MPELPDVAAYIAALEPRIVGKTLRRIRLSGISLLRTATPPISTAEGRTVREIRRIGKRIAIGVEGNIWLVLHLMIAGRLHWRSACASSGAVICSAAFDFTDGTLTLTEAGSKRRASLHVVDGEAGARWHRSWRIDVFQSDLHAFASIMRAENRTLNVPSPIRASSTASGTPTQTRSFTPRSSRLRH